MARDTPDQNNSDAAAATTDQLPNLVTIVGRGVPSQFELAVDGELEMIADSPVAEATVVSGNAAEGAIDVGVQRFRFSGEMANVHLADWNGNEAPTSASVPTVHVEYGAPGR